MPDTPALPFDEQVTVRAAKLIVDGLLLVRHAELGGDSVTDFAAVQDGIGDAVAEDLTAVTVAYQAVTAALWKTLYTQHLGHDPMVCAWGEPELALPLIVDQAVVHTLTHLAIAQALNTTNESDTP